MCYASDRTSIICRVVKLLEYNVYQVTMLYPYVFVANTSDDSASKVSPIETLSSCALLIELASDVTSSRL